MRRERIGDLLLKFSRKDRVPQSEFAVSGETPIVDQSSGTLVVGYTDNAAARDESPLPITLFGDHTREVKFVDFPFASGADGTQLLYPNTPDLDPIYFYYAVKHVDLSTYFYARHFKFLKEQFISIPGLRVQLQIADLLKTYDDLMENNRRRMELLEEAARQLYVEWFVHLRFPGHEHKRIVNGLPEGWSDSRVSDLGEVLTGKTPSTTDTDNYGGEVPLIKTPDMHGNVFVVRTETTLTEKGANTQPQKFVPAHTLLVSCIGTVGVVAMTSAPAQFNQQINAVVPFDQTYGYYLFFALRDLKDVMEGIGGGATMGNVSKGKFEGLKVSKPGASVLRSFHEFCAPSFQLMHSLSIQNLRLRAARDLLLPRLMSGEIAV